MEEKKQKDTLKIHIDKNNYESPDPTTGAALYALGNINPEEYDLFKEVHGHGDDLPIANNSTEVNVTNGDHFFSVKKKLNPGGSDVSDS